MVTYYLFSGATSTSSREVIKIGLISRQSIYLVSSKTNFKFVDISDKFYDNELEKQKCMSMTDGEFDATVIKTFIQQGYKFIEKKEIK